MAFDKNQLTCVPKNEAVCADEVTTAPTPGVCYGVEDYTLVRHPTNCAAYYECLGGHGEPSFCPPGKYFSEKLQGCDEADNVDC